VFAAVHVIGTGRAGGAVRARLAQRGLRVTDGRDANPAAELVLLCVPDR
jgi:predicted dinucleotide-binding enzyme